MLPPKAGAFRGVKGGRDEIVKDRVKSLGKEEEMPIYDYSCSNCGRKFSVKHSIKEHVHKKERCPKCKSRKVERIISDVLIKTSKKS